VTKRKKHAPKLSKFEQFIRGFGVDAIARRLDVNSSAVYHWLGGNASPHPTNAIKIQRIAKQRGVTLSLDEIYQHFREVQSEQYTVASLKPEPARVL
jgi:hypothetical protein